MSRLPDWARRGLRTFIQTFIGVFSLTLLGFVAKISEWADSSGDPFPSLDPLAKGLVAAFAAAAAALVSVAQNYVEDRSGRSLLVSKGSGGTDRGRPSPASWHGPETQPAAATPDSVTPGSSDTPPPPPWGTFHDKPPVAPQQEVEVVEEEAIEVEVAEEEAVQPAPKPSPRKRAAPSTPRKRAAEADKVVKKAAKRRPRPGE